MLHLPALIQDLGIILFTAGIVTLIFKKIKQPVVLGYLIAGFLVGPEISFLPTIQERDAIQVIAEGLAVFGRHADLCVNAFAGYINSTQYAQLLHIAKERIAKRLRILNVVVFVEGEGNPLFVRLADPLLEQTAFNFVV